MDTQQPKQPQEMEQTMVDYLLDYLLEKIRVEKGLSLDDVASRVYGAESIARSRLKLYRLRKPKKDGTVKKLTLEDYVSICQAMDVDPVRILALNLEKVARS